MSVVYDTLNLPVSFSLDGLIANQGFGAPSRSTITATIRQRRASNIVAGACDSAETSHCGMRYPIKTTAFTELYNLRAPGNPWEHTQACTRTTLAYAQSVNNKGTWGWVSLYMDKLQTRLHFHPIKRHSKHYGGLLIMMQYIWVVSVQQCPSCWQKNTPFHTSWGGQSFLRRFNRLYMHY